MRFEREEKTAFSDSAEGTLERSLQALNGDRRSKRGAAGAALLFFVRIADKLERWPKLLLSFSPHCVKDLEKAFYPAGGDSKGALEPKRSPYASLINNPCSFLPSFVLGRLIIFR